MAVRAGERRTPDLERARLYEGVVGLLRWSCRTRPLVLLLDDVHLADDATLDLTAYVLRRMATEPVLVVLTARSLPRRPGLERLEAALRSQRLLAVELVLTALGPADSADLVRQVASLPLAQVDEVVASADGSPLLLVEAAGAIARGDPAPTGGLRALVRTGLVDLSPEALHLAGCCTVAGRPLDRAEVERLLGDAARAATLAVADGSLLGVERGRVGFRHALLREAAYADLTPAAREQLHEAFGSVLAGFGDDRAAEAAHHLRRGGRDDLARPVLVRAATHARSLTALDDAAALLREALDLEPADGASWLELAEVEAFRGDVAASEAAFVRALPVLPGTPARADAWCRRAVWSSGAICDPRQAREAARTAVTLLTQEAGADDGEDAGVDPALLVESLANWSWAESVSGDAELAEELLARVHRLLGGQRPDDRLVPAISRARAFVLLRRGDFQDSYPVETASAEAAQRIDRPDLAYGSWMNAACAASCIGEFERALDFVDRALQVLDGTGLHALEVHVLAGRAHLLARLGRDDDARAAAARQQRLAERVGDEALLAATAHDRGLLALGLGDDDAAARLLRRALRGGGAVSRPATRLARAEALVHLCRYAEAEREVRLAALEPTRPGDMPETLVPRLSRLQGLVAVARGDEALGRRRLEEAGAAWRGVIARGARGDRYVAALTDFGRPPVVGLVEPERELARVEDELTRLPVRTG